MLADCYLLLTRYLTVQYEKLNKLFSQFNYVWFYMISLSHNNVIIKNICENNTFIDLYKVEYQYCPVNLKYEKHN